MKLRCSLSLMLLALAGCESAPTVSPTAQTIPMNPKGPNWEEIDKTVQRVKAREQGKTLSVQTTSTVEHGFFPMSDDDYNAELDKARADIRKANPKMAAADVEKEATLRADEAKRKAESSPGTRASASVEITK